MRLAISIVLCVVVLAVIGYGVLAFMNRPISEETVTGKIEHYLTHLLDNNDSLSSILLTISSNRTGYHEQFAVGTKNFFSKEPVRADSQYHSASIGKTMCAVVYGMLADEGRISLDDKITTWLDADTLRGLFVVKGTDYSGQVTLRHLLSHTSGVGDYFAGPVHSGQPMLERITADPNLSFTPERLIAFTRDYQNAVGLPGERFYYSDTGYILLGFILEQMEGKGYADILEQRIFKPLGMKDSYFMTEQKETADILGIYMNGIDFSDKKAISVDWSGGGVVTTMNDLLTFMKALEQGSLLSDAAYGQMTDFTHRYGKGIYYGMGMMYFDFSKLSFLLSTMPDVYGGVGATGTYVLYDKKRDTYFIANFGSLDFTEKAIEELVKIRMIYDRMKVE